MSDEAAFLAAIRAAPDDNTNRLVYADWLDEAGRAGAAFLRAEHELAALPLGNSQWHEGFAGLRQAAAGLSPEWCQAARRYPPSHWLAAAARSAWVRIAAVLEATAPDLLAALPAGASSADVAGAEQRLGVELPADVRESFAVHDGSGEHTGFDVPRGYVDGVLAGHLLSLDEVVSKWETWPKEPAGPGICSPHWVPLTGMENYNVCIDLDPAPDGVPGQVILVIRTVLQGHVAEGWWAFLERYAADLESGRLRFEGGELVEDWSKHAEPLSWPTDLNNK